ncbi:YlxQ-related RNA-binding protein [Agrilactobacillus composti]|uniref:YlxQ-related RNA-binding protein n=1 Tax=Agrilactobacillus composti TaxID=398555 RepID=UPI0005588014|nr:YlxQ-related RNA-binding protein [Agrilactobacillus composti]MCH4170500.1 YlxQ-related RNA-binding protein [Lactobacillus sp.]
MDQTQKLMNLIGLAMRAGKIITGEELVLKALIAGKLKLVFIASDAGSATTKKLNDKTTYYHVPIHDQLSTEQLTKAIGRPRKIIGINDAGFAKGMVKLM